jgi:hypothetical protein
VVGLGGEPVRTIDLGGSADRSTAPHRGGRKTWWLAAAACVLAIVAVAALLARGDDAPDLAVGTAAELYALPPADAGNLEVGGNPEAGVGFYYDDPAGGRLILMTWDWGNEGVARNLRTAEQIRSDGAEEKRSETFGSVFVACWSERPSNLSSPTSIALGFGPASATWFGESRQFGLAQTGREDRVCDPDSNGAELQAAMNDLRLVSRQEWVDFITARSPG